MRPLAVTCFFLSGASGLIFQVIWSRMFSLVFGATTLAISTVLTAFMGGLALGSYISGRIADRIRDPLRAYALAEAGIGLCALALPAVIVNFDGLNSYLYQHYADNYAVLAGGRFVASALVILLPTTLMGATLPLLSRFFVRSQGEHNRVGLRVGALYAVNTAGAVLGTLLGGFVLLPNLGLTATNRIAAATNLLLAAFVGLAYLVRRRRAPEIDSQPDPELSALVDEIGPVRAPPIAIAPNVRRAALVAFAVSGAAAMIYEVIWTRALNMAIGSSVYSFTIVLAAFLVGLAGGAALIGRLSAGSRNPVGLLALNHLVIAILVGLSYLLLDKLGHVFLSFIGRTALDADRILAAQLGVTLLAMLPATLAMGGIFPLTIRIYASGVDRVGRDVGNAYSINTIGAIVGSFGAGFIVIPILQLQPGLYAAASLNLALAAMLGWLAYRGRSLLRLVTVGGAVVLVIGGPLLPRWNLSHFAAGVFRPTVARDVIESGEWEAPKMVYYRDGITTTVTVEQWSAKHFSLKNNGKVDASTGDDMPTQVVVGLLPLLLHPRAPDFRPEVALVGYASGVSAGSVLQFPVKRLDVVELEPATIEGARWFNHVNHQPLKDPRTHLYTDDGRNFLAAGSARYDVIINEPSNPWVTGVSNLFTREYFQIGRRRLKRDGIFCTWAQLYEMGPRRIKSIYRAFASVFPHVYAFSAATLSSDTFLIGSNQPLKLDIRKLRRSFAIPTVRAEMDRAEVPTPDDLVALTLLGPREVESFVVGAEINTDDNALVEFKAPQDLYNHRQFDYYLSNIYGQQWLYGRLSGFLAGYRTSADHAGLIRGLLTHGKFREANVFFDKIDAKADASSRRVSQLMDVLGSREQHEQEFDLTEEGPPLLPPPGPLPPADLKQIGAFAEQYTHAERLARRGDFRGALDTVEQWDDELREDGGDDFQLFWAYLAYKTSNFHQAVNILEPHWKKGTLSGRRPVMLYYLGRAFYGNADFAKAVEALEGWIEHRVKLGKPITPPVPDKATSRPASELAPEPDQPASEPAT